MRIEDLPTPALLLDLDVLERNLARMQDLADRCAVRLRPHVKTHKCIEIGRRQIALGAAGICASTFAEAAAFARSGFGDITWALPNPLSHLSAVFALSEETNATIRLLTDDLAAFGILERAARSRDRRLHVFLKVDCGYHRAGVDPRAPAALELIEALDRSNDVLFDGILTHAGHGYHARGKAELLAIAGDERAVMLELAERAKRRGHTFREISIGSTPTLSVADRLDGISEIRPGNYVFYDYTQVALGSCALEDCATTVLASVISHQRGARRFVTDAGALALSKDSGPDHLTDSDHSGMGKVFADYPARRLADGVRFEQLSQEHGIVAAESAEQIERGYAVGEKIRVLENHSCLCAALFDEYNVVRGDEVIGTWKIERKR
jgi:D-serine deaminase-like pyridoxal phosphate-dependent protein